MSCDKPDELKENTSSVIDSKEMEIDSIGIQTSKKNYKKLNKSEEKTQLSLLNNIRKPVLKRISHRAGCKRLESETHEEMKLALHDHLRRVIKQSLILMIHNQRNTLILDDVLYALRQNSTSIASVYL